MGRRCINDNREIIYYISKYNSDAEKLYLFEGSEEWLTFEKAFSKYSPRSYQWRLFEEPLKQKQQVYR